MSAEKQDPGKIQTILDAARKRFAHYGVAKTTMNEIALDAGMSKASLYYYFPDKEHLFTEVLRNEMEKFLSESDRMRGQSIPASEQMRQYVDLRFTCFKQFLNLATLASTNEETFKSAFARLHNDFIEREKEIIQSILKAGMKSREFEKLDATMHADLFVSILRGLRVMILKRRENFILTPEDYDSLKNYQTEFVSVYVKGISKK
jgi:TetR/AcrR family transcriptional repressor of mexJK operon